MCTDPSPKDRHNSGHALPDDRHVILPDGVKLATRIWTPQGGDGPWPALLMRQPYGRSIASTVTYAHPRWWATQGFLVVVQDVRGQGDSEGKFRGFSQEAADTSATMTWIRQQPDCNGRIGLYGFSYQGFTQVMAEPGTTPPDCLAPAMTGLDERDHWSCEGGAHWWHLGLGWGLQLAALQAQRRKAQDAWDEIRCCLEHNRHWRDGLALLRRHDPNGMALRWLEQSPADDDGWIQHQPPIAWIQRPMLLIGGWWDPHLRGVLDLYRRSLAAGGQPELHIGPATHLQWWPEAQQLHLDFFRRHLLKSPCNAPPPATTDQAVQVWDQRAKRWTAIGASDANGGTWRLTGSSLACHDPNDGRLIVTSSKGWQALQADDGGDDVVIVHDPWRPTPAIGGHLSPTPGPCDRASVDARTDVATFTSAPLEQPLQLRGRPVLSLPASADQPGFDLCISLAVCPAGSGESHQLSTGVMRVIGNQAFATSTYTITLQGLEARLVPGDRLRLSVAAACWPAIAINPGTGSHTCGPPTLDCRVINVHLRVAEADLRILPLIVPFDDR
ncbi:MAG: CocE/NonD family hydrolase [Synechococcus sp.]